MDSNRIEQTIVDSCLDVYRDQAEGWSTLDGGDLRTLDSTQKSVTSELPGHSSLGVYQSFHQEPLTWSKVGLEQPEATVLARLDDLLIVRLAFENQGFDGLARE
jgi:hypothetical protein